MRPGWGELPLSVFDEFSRRIPQVASIYPASEFDMVDFYEGGGVPAVLKEIEGIPAQRYPDGIRPYNGGRHCRGFLIPITET